jgi:DNA repair ATPase RecN
VQTQLVLQEMAAEAQKSEDRWDRVLESLEKMNQRLEDVDAVQRQLVGQVEVAVQVAQQAAKERSALTRQVEEAGRVLARL